MPMRKTTFHVSGEHIKQCCTSPPHMPKYAAAQIVAHPPFAQKVSAHIDAWAHRMEQLERECGSMRQEAAAAGKAAEAARADNVKLVERARYLQQRYSAARAARVGSGAESGFEVVQVDVDGADASLGAQVCEANRHDHDRASVKVAYAGVPNVASMPHAALPEGRTNNKRSMQSARPQHSGQRVTVWGPVFLGRPHWHGMDRAAASGKIQVLQLNHALWGRCAGSQGPQAAVRPGAREPGRGFGEPGGHAAARAPRRLFWRRGRRAARRGRRRRARDAHRAEVPQGGCMHARHLCIVALIM